MSKRTKLLACLCATLAAPLAAIEKDTVNLSEVIVIAPRTPRPVKLSPILTRVLGGKAMLDAGHADLQQVLEQETPGLNIRKTGFGNEINVQGLDARHVLFLIDGERMTGDMAGNLDYERFNLHAIDRIEIVKGAGSALYGSRASGAVINLITKKPSQPLAVDAGLRYAQMNERNYPDPHKKDFLYMYEKNADRPNRQSWASVGVKTGAFASQTDVWYAESDAFNLYQKAGDKKVYTREANPFLDSDVEIVSELARPPMGVDGGEHISASQKLFFEPSANLKMQLYATSFFKNTYDMVQDLVFTQSRDFTGGAKVTYDLKTRLSLTAAVHADRYNRYKRHERRDERKTVYKSRILQHRFALTGRYFSGHDLTLGMEYFTDELTSDRFVNRKMTSRALKETEYFFQDEWTAGEKWALTAGIHSLFSKPFGWMWAPKLAVKYSPAEQWSFRAVFSSGYRLPSIKELFFNWSHLAMFVIKGNEFLRPETNRYVSLGAEYSDSRLFVNANFYGNFFRDKIEGVWRIYDMQYNFEYTNLGWQNLRGVEAVARWQASDYFTLNVSYAYVDVGEPGGVRINTASPHAATGGAEYRYCRKNGTFAAGFSASYMGRKRFDVQDRVYVEKEGRSRDAWFRCDLPAYTLCNLTLSQTFYKLKITAGINNLFNYKPATLGSGLTAFSVPATAGARGYIQFTVKN
ncbi:MAG: TonB-dependent receptor [Dysgonamonadaceae bacterium]|jgi:outer membrane receptor for ferrienterochelin and colicin|nr:TonB-dependent receptor [Dysgonamonadaceae bacterium]